MLNTKVPTSKYPSEHLEGLARDLGVWCHGTLFELQSAYDREYPELDQRTGELHVAFAAQLDHEMTSYDKAELRVYGTED